MSGSKASTKQELEIEGRIVTVSNLDKVMFPAAGFTKAQLIDFYIRVSPFLLPHFEQRPVTLKRFPDGVSGEAFYEKDLPKFAPQWVTTFPVPRRTGGKDIRYVLINDVATLVWCAQAASVELHPFLHRAPELDQPRSIVFDLDPGEGADILNCIDVAFQLRDLLSPLGLQAFPKVSGSKGLQIYAPLNTPVNYEQTRTFAHAVASLLAREHPTAIVAEMAKSERHNKVFIDWSQNSDFKTTVGVYSMRAKLPRPFVSMPVTWEELERVQSTRKIDPLFFSPQHALDRLGEVGDLFAPVLALKQQLPIAPTAIAPKQPSPKVPRKQPELPAPSKQGSRRRFVIQKHAASHLHFDFRLEMHDVLKSWAVPKGVPYQMGDKRLAMATEDHPVAYLEFEGVIPQGQYGGGTVMVWDIGTYEVIEGNYFKGWLSFHLDGKKLQGQWELKRDARSKERNVWKLIKSGTTQQSVADVSALSGRSMEAIAAANDKQWHSNRTSVPGLDLDALPQSEMRFVEPMQCKLVAELPGPEGWQYELKLDGYRALALKTAGKLQLLSRRNNLLNEKFKPVADALDFLPDGVTIDGEVVALDEAGRPAFSLLQHYKPGHSPLVFYAFDLLAYRGRDLRTLPLSQRRQLLEEVLGSPPDDVRLSASLQAPPETLIDAVRKQGLEGLIAKKLSSRYESGERSGNWIKYKTDKGQELVVGGYRPSGKDFFDNLAVGYYEGKRLIFIAKLKNGFTPDSKRELWTRIEKLSSDKCPFANLPEPKNARRGEALTAEAMRNYRWIRPKLVVQAQFTDWTSSNHLRHSKFVGIRDDKDPREVVHETAED